jgi:molybdate transport system ATP-binding protein
VITVAAACRLSRFTLDVAFRSVHRRVVLFGPSGAGKTVTLQCIAGFLSPPRGYVAIDDVVLLDTARGVSVPPWRRRLGAVLQGDGLFPHLSVGDNVTYGMRRIWRGREATRALALLAAVGLTGFAERRPADLSAGEQQRVALARALASDPHALLLDEPFAAVDAPMREQLRRDFLALVESRALSTVVVTHDFDEAHVLGETIVVLAGGRVVQTGVPADVARYPRTATVARLVGAANVLTADVAGRDAAGRLLRAGPFVLRAPLAPENAARVDVCVRPEQLRVRTARPGGSTDAGGAAPVRGRVHRVLRRQAGATLMVTAGGLQLEAWVTGPSPAPGDAVDVSIPDEAVHVLEPEVESAPMGVPAGSG